MFGNVEAVIERVYKRDEEVKIALCVPSLGMVSLPWHARTSHIMWPMNTSRIESYVIGKPVDQARNELVATCLNEGASWIFFIDDDVLVPQDALVRLFAHKKPMVSGVYFLKTDVPQPLILKGICGGLFTNWEKGDIIECDGHGMGCTLLSKEVFDAMMPHVPKDERGIPQWFKTRDAEPLESNPLKALSMTEDTDFCAKAKSLGFQPTVDTGVYCWHWDKNNMTAYPTQEWKREVAALEAKAC